MRKKRIEPGIWQWPDRPRVLIEDPDLESGLTTAQALRRAGYTVAICRGPEPDEYCPLVGPFDCALVAGADIVVSGVGPEIEGSPSLSMKIAGGIHGDVATASIVVNSIPKVLAAAPGFHTMRDLPLPSFFPGR